MHTLLTPRTLNSLPSCLPKLACAAASSRARSTPMPRTMNCLPSCLPKLACAYCSCDITSCAVCAWLIMNCILHVDLSLRCAFYTASSWLKRLVTSSKYSAIQVCHFLILQLYISHHTLACASIITPGEVTSDFKILGLQASTTAVIRGLIPCFDTLLISAPSSSNTVTSSTWFLNDFQHWWWHYIIVWNQIVCRSLLIYVPCNNVLKDLINLKQGYTFIVRVVKFVSTLEVTHAIMHVTIVHLPWPIHWTIYHEDVHMQAYF